MADLNLVLFPEATNNASDTKHRIMICILPLILPKMITLVKLINNSSIIKLRVHPALLKHLECPQNKRITYNIRIV